MHRDRAQREKRLIEAVGEIVSQEGFDHLGINKIAQRAEVNKILIYRYFGGLKGLIEAYIKQEKPVVLAPLLDTEQLRNASLEELIDACREFIINEFRLLRNNVPAQEFLKADFMTLTGSQNPVASEKEKQLRAIIDEVSAIVGSQNGRAFSALVVSGLAMLTFAAQQKKVVFGIDLQTEEGWTKIETAVGNIFRGAYLFTKERMEMEGKLATDKEQP